MKKICKSGCPRSTNVAFIIPPGYSDECICLAWHLWGYSFTNSKLWILIVMLLCFDRR